MPTAPNLLVQILQASDDYVVHITIPIIVQHMFYLESNMQLMNIHSLEFNRAAALLGEYKMLLDRAKQRVGRKYVEHQPIEAEDLPSSALARNLQI